MAGGANMLAKVLTAGDGGVGKTTLLHRFIKGEFMSDTKMTIGVGFFLETLQVKGKTVRLQFWDFGGQEQFRNVLPIYTSGATGAMLMVDLTRPDTARGLEEWVGLCRKDNSELPILLVGTKLDKSPILVTDGLLERQVQKHDLYGYIKTSSKTGENVHQSFQMMAKCVLNGLASDAQRTVDLAQK
jgi:small GTP-binding protein